MAGNNAEHLSDVIEYLRREGRPEDVSLNDVMGLAEVMTSSLQTYFKSFDLSVYGELGDMAREITAMKTELADLRLSDVRNERIPAAGRELDAIVDATETATNTIMSAAEAIMSADPSDAEAYQAVVNDKVVEIFEACSFQDITGQRISKVVNTLSHLDGRINSLINRLKLMRVDESMASPVEETAEDRRKRELILHGPQLAGEGVSQDDIDALLR